jgi:purine-binding chemotaxis protein CheW
LPADVVQEVVEVGPLTCRLPGKGGDRVRLVRVRDRWLPVVELKSLITGIPAVELGQGACMLLVVGHGRSRMALPVDDFAELQQSINSDMGSSGKSARYVEVDDQLVRVIETERLLFAGQLGEAGGGMAEMSSVPEALRVVTFCLGGEEFGIDVMKVFEILHVPEVRAVPRAPEFVEGVVSLREAILPVIDMRKLFSLPRGQEDSSRLIITAIGDSRVGLVVDSVPGVVPLAPESITPPPEYFKGLAGRYLEGIASDEARLIILLDVEEILSSKERIALQDLMKDPEVRPPQDSISPSKRRGGKGQPTEKPQG